MADLKQAEATRTLRSWGLWSTKSADAIWRFDKSRQKDLKLPEESGKADMIVARAGRMVFVEVKDGDSSFSFVDYRQNQRDWAKTVKRDFGLETYIMLFLGENRPTDKVNPRRAWLIPRLAFLAAERMIRPHQSSIPMIAGKGYNAALQAANLDAVHLFKSYELAWNGGWTLPLGHRFRIYLKYDPTPVKPVGSQETDKLCPMTSSSKQPMTLPLEPSPTIP